MAKRFCVFCVFCGNPPAKKNREHVLPQWLLRMTGDPRRVVKMGMDYRTGDPIEFSWSSLAVPACKSCNERYSQLEEIVSDIVEKLNSRIELTGSEYVLLLDWLDKVRIGLWLTYHQILRNPTGIDPSFYIESRIRAKDRMVAIYPNDSQPDGLNAWGVESLLFHRTPACMMLRINQTLILNVSFDYMIAARCGFPAPALMQTWIDGDFGGRMECGDFSASRRIRSPLLRKGLFKPALLLFQPILMKDIQGVFDTGLLGLETFGDSYLQQHCYDIQSGLGCLFQQHPGKVSPVYDPMERVSWNSVDLLEAKPTYELVAQLYDLQCFTHAKMKFSANDNDRLRKLKKENKSLIRMGQMVKEMHLKLGRTGAYREMSETYNRSRNQN